nr:hypothetical protein OG513_00045 [Streptomyces sp. NBC_00998]
MVIAVPPADLDRLDALVDAQKTAETRWQASAEQQAGLLDLRAGRARIRGERDRLRETGTRGLLRDWVSACE